MAEMANNIWSGSGDKITRLFEDEDELKDFSFVIVGHSLGAGVACLLQIKCYKEKLLGDRTVKCFGFAPPPTFCTDMLLKDSEDAASIQRAIDHTLCYIHDNDCVPFMSVMAIRRLATLMDTVDNRTEHMWAFRRFKIFWEWEMIPQELVDDVKAAEENKAAVKCCAGASRLIIPAKMIVWMKKNFAGSYEGFGCDPGAVADLNIFCCQDMISDHLVEPYEDALDELAGRT
jgi:Lipase (class 3)